jgi:hypothetical protein
LFEGISGLKGDDCGQTDQQRGNAPVGEIGWGSDDFVEDVGWRDEDVEEFCAN